MNRERELLKRVYKSLGEWIPAKLKDEIKEELAKPYTNPVAIFRGKRLVPEGTKEFFGDLLVDDLDAGSRLYLSPPQQNSLSEEEIKRIRIETPSSIGSLDFARAIEKAHGIE